MPRTTRGRVLAVTVIAIAGVIAFLLFRPDKLFADDPVDESVDDAFAVATTVGEPPEATAVPPSPTTVLSPTVSPTTPRSTTSAPATSKSPSTTTTAVEPVAIASGALFGIDHQAVGTATVYRRGNDHILRFEDDTDIQNGPDLHVWFLATDSYQGGIPEDYLYLGLLKGNVGGQNYQLPDEYDPAVHRFVLVWCDRFSVPFTGAALDNHPG
jgi:hypothetical protein